MSDRPAVETVCPRCGSPALLHRRGRRRPRVLCGLSVSQVWALLASVEWSDGPVGGVFEGFASSDRV